MSDFDNKEGNACRWTGDMCAMSMPSSQFCWKLETAPKNKVLKKYWHKPKIKKRKRRWTINKISANERSQLKKIAER